ncbi:MAG: hypothetical protein Q8M98_10940, partial [Candidatus Cloacimonadaceae bacterium]|nr:hypothetical protein [Candidatus Cloacimonadaceae bacterium]
GANQTVFDILNNTHFKSHAITIYGLLFFHFLFSLEVDLVSTFLGRDKNRPQKPIKNLSSPLALRYQYGVITD